jgi:hypothetical protein
VHTAVFPCLAHCNSLVRYILASHMLDTLDLPVSDPIPWMFMSHTSRAALDIWREARRRVFGHVPG